MRAGGVESPSARNLHAPVRHRGQRVMEGWGGSGVAARAKGSVTRPAHRKRGRRGHRGERAAAGASRMDMASLSSLAPGSSHGVSRRKGGCMPLLVPPWHRAAETDAGRRRRVSRGQCRARRPLYSRARWLSWVPASGLFFCRLACSRRRGCAPHFLFDAWPRPHVDHALPPSSLVPLIPSPPPNRAAIVTAGAAARDTARSREHWPLVRPCR